MRRGRRASPRTATRWPPVHPRGARLRRLDDDAVLLRRPACASADPEGVRSLPGAGPYVVREYRPGAARRRSGRNRATAALGHHVDGFDVDLSAASSGEVLDRIESGKADWGFAVTQEHLHPGRALLVKYGQKRRFFLKPGLSMAFFVLNSSRPRPLFEDNPQLRRAINLAVDRFAFIGPGVLQLTDQYLPPRVAGYQDRQIYPLEGDVARAKALAAGHLRGGKLVLYVPDCPGALACAQILARQFAQIGLDVELRTLPGHASPSAYLGRLGNPNEPWDAALIIWTPNSASILSATSTGCSARGTAAAPTWPGSARSPIRNGCAMRRVSRGRHAPPRLPRPRPGARSRCRADRAALRHGRRHSRLGTRRLPPPPACARADDGVPEGLNATSKPSDGGARRLSGLAVRPVRVDGDRA